MKFVRIVFLCALVLGCKSKASLSSSELEYVQTTLDLLRTRANFAPGMDSIHVQLSLDSVYRRHHTSGSDYRKQAASLGDDPKRAEAVFTAINDSIGQK